MTDYLTIEGVAEYGFEISRSSFLCKMMHTDTLEDAMEFAARIKKQFSDATHNCYAFVGAPESNQQKFSDDGEPSGTAGHPMLGVLVKNGLYSVTAVVTRYFGGIKLGAGGLVGAYTKAVAECVSRARIVKNVWSAIYEAALTYSEYKVAEKRFKEEGVKVIDVAFNESVTVRLATPLEVHMSIDTYLRKLMQGQNRYSLNNYEYIIYER